MNPEHPPLMKLLSAAPLLLLPLRMPIDHPTWINADQWGFGSVFVYENTISADTIMRVSRIPTIILSVLIGVLIYKWSRQLFGPYGALLSVTLFAVDATMIAHSHYVTTDAVATLGFLLTIFTYRQYLMSSQPRWLWVTAFAFVFALLSKFSSVLLAPLLVILWFVHRVSYGVTPATRIRSLAALILSCAVVFVIGSYVVYGFQSTIPITDRDTIMVLEQMESIRNAPDPSAAAPGGLPSIAKTLDPETGFGSSVEWMITNVPIPAFDFYRGLVSVFLHNTYGHASYLLGEHANSFWNYFIIAFLTKTSNATLLFGALTLLALALSFMRIVRGWWQSRTSRESRATSLRKFLHSIPFDVYALTIPVVLYFLWSLTARINLGVRHLLPIYPFLWIGIGYLTTFRFRRPLQTVWVGCLSLMIAAELVFTLSMFPFFLSYFNAFVGGPEQGHEYLLDSNVEWGQDLKRLKAYLDNHDESAPIYLQYFGTARPEYYGIEFSDPPRFVTDPAPRLDRLMILSVDAILSAGGEYAWVLDFQPVDRIGYSMYIYDFR